MGLLGIPQERIAQRLGVTQRIVESHLHKSSELKSGVNSQLERGFGVNTIAEKLGMERETVGKHLVKNSELKKLPNELLTKGFLPNTIAEKLGWPEPLVWAVALEGKDDKTRLDKLQWNIRP